MEKPGWATFMGIFFLLIAGCGGLDNITEMNADQIVEFQSDILEEIDSETSEENVELDSIQLDSSAQERLSMFGDSIVKDSANNVDVKETLKGIMKISDYRLKWMRSFAYIGLVISCLFAISGIFFLARRKFTIQLAIATLALSLVVGIFQFIIFRADTESGKMISNMANIEVYWSIFLDIILLVSIMVLDKSYYNNAATVEDYYDS